jgi:hypothetical protein
MRRTIALVLVALLGLGAALGLANPATASAADNLSSPNRVYFPQTGHTLSYGFLQYWHDNGGITVFGYPITEELQESGLTVQYFERARFEYHPENQEPYRVLLGLLGTDAVEKLTSSPLNATTVAPKADQVYFQETGHSLSFAFKDFWQANGGLAIFGYPISEELSEGGLTVQYFERARFEYHAEIQPPDQVLLTQLGRLAAEAKGVDLSPVPQPDGAQTYSPSLFPKWIEVDLTNQILYAHEGGARVFTTLISSGLAWHPTPTGTFYVERKLISDLMAGGSGADAYYLPGVPYVMYFIGGYSIHGTYWHNNFGHPMSHGCVNAPTPAAQWLYNWAPMGTPVVIHY